MMAWKCGLIHKGGSCPHEQYQALGCCKLNLKAALQQLRWSLPFVGKYFKTHEHLVECHWGLKK